MELLLLLAVPILIAVAGLVYSGINGDSRYQITWKEFLVILGVVVAVVAGGYAVGRNMGMYDKEVWSGRVVVKKQEWTSCSHSYSCNCRETCSGSGSSRSCSQTCDTCYEHSNDWNWVLYTNNDESIFIDRIDRRGSSEPPRFTQAQIGDPTAIVHSFKNYIKANPWTILRRQGLQEQFKDFIPDYPLDIFDYHYINRFLSAGAPVSGNDADFWNNYLMQLNADLGAQKQVNIIFVAVGTTDSAYIHALEESWLGGKKNDLIVIFGAPKYPKIEWVRIMSWTQVEDLKISLRDELEKVGTFANRAEIMRIVKEEIGKKFVRRHMADFEYLAATARPPMWMTVLLFILGTGLSIGLSLFFFWNDPFGDN